MSAARLLRHLFQPPRLRAPAIPGESLRVERVIAAARLLVAAIAFLIVDLDQAGAGSQEFVTRTLIVLFAAHGAAAFAVLRSRQRTSAAYAVTVHAIDLVSAAAITLPLMASSRVFFIFFLFVQAAAAFRWGLRETLLTTLAAIALVVLETQAAARFQLVELTALGGGGEDQLVLRATYLAMMGFLLGYFAEESRELRAESAAALELLARIRVEAGLPRVLDVLGRELKTLFNASHLMLVLEDATGRRLLRWDTAGGFSAANEMTPGSARAPDRQTYFFGPRDHTLAFRRRRRLIRSSAFETTAVDTAGRSVDTAGWQVPPAFAAAHPFSRVIVAPIQFGDEWAGRLFVFEPAVAVPTMTLTHFLQTLVRQVTPAVFNVYLQDQLQARAGSIERARVARELHDGVIQSLISVEMQLKVLRNQDGRSSESLGEDLSRLQHLVHEEVLNLRDLMQQMRPPALDPEELLDYLAHLVDRFGRDTGITARFASNLRNVPLSDRVCFEIVRIVQEGLVNVRRHSRAKNVLVRFSTREGHWILEIDDDGQGFPFEGRKSHSDLEADRRGPIIIKERVRAIGGRLAIDSTPGRGSRLEILVPQESSG